MKKQISVPVAVGVIAALALLVIVGVVLRQRAASPVVHLGQGDTFDMKSGRVVPKSEGAPGAP